MSIVCGTDFSAGSEKAVRVAALLAARTGDLLRLVHVVDEVGAELTIRTKPSVYNPRRTRLRAAARSATELGARVDELLVAGNAAEVLSTAGGADARLIVVSSLGERAPARWLLGSVSERVARVATAPVLVVRDAVPFEAWIGGARRLSIMLALDLSESSDAALRWARELRRVGPCDVTLAHVACPSEEHDRLGLGRPIDVERIHPDLEVALLRELRKRGEGLGGDGDVTCVVRQGVGRTEDDLVASAEQASVDLLVVGSHQRSGVGRLWHRSVSRGVLHLAPMSVASVPKSRGREVRTIPPLRRILVGTDFSETAERALAIAMSLLPSGGTVHFVHVLPPALGKTPLTSLVPIRSVSDEDWLQSVTAAKARLEQLASEAAEVGAIEVVVDVLEGYVADEVCRAAERLDVDLLCIGSRARPSLSAALRGSVAHEILARSRRPVLVVPPRER